MTRDRAPGHRHTKGLFYGWVVLAVAFVVMAFGFALRNSFSVFYPAIVDHFDWSRGNTAIIFSLNIFLYGLMAPVVGHLVDRFEPRLVLSAGICVVGGTVALCSVASTQWQFYLLFGAVLAAGLSMTGITPLGAIVTGWFTEKRGLVFGVLAAGFGASLIAASIAQFLISSLGWQRAYLVIGLCAIVVIVPLVLLFVRRGPARRAASPEGGSPGQEGPSAPPPDSPRDARWTATTWTLRGAVRTPQLWLLFFAGFCQVGLAEKVTIAHQVYFFRDVGYEPMTAATIYSVFGVAFVAGTLLSSISDRLGREAVYVPACVLGAGAAGLLFLIQDTSNSWMPFVFAVCFGLALGVTPPVLFAAVADLFHGRGYGAIQGFIVFGISMGGAFSPWLGGFLHDRTGTYHGAFVLLVASLLVCGILMFLAAPRHLAPVSK